MSQADLGSIPNPTLGATLAGLLTAWRDALHSMHKGATRPSYAVAGTAWIREVSASAWQVVIYDGVDADLVIGTMNPLTNAFTPSGVVGASETEAGVVESATQAELNSGADDARFVTPLKLATWAPNLSTVVFDRAADFLAIVDASDSNRLKKAVLSAVNAVAVIADQKTAGSPGGTFTSGAWQPRDLNTELADPDGIVTIAANLFTLASGTYKIRATAPAYQVAEHQARIYNVTDAAVVAVGMSQRNSGSGQTTTTSIAVTIVTIAASKAFRIEHRCSSSGASQGFGVAGGWGTEQYTTVEITKLA